MELIEFMRVAFLLVVCRGQTVKPNDCANRLPDFNCTVKVRFFEHNPFVICNQLLSEDMEVNGRPVITWPSGVEAANGSTYLLLFVDPDAPKPCLSTGYFLHYVIPAKFNIRYKYVIYQRTTIILDYLDLIPAIGTGTHRYQILLYTISEAKLTAAIANIANINGTRGPGLSLDTYLAKFGLAQGTVPVASFQFLNTADRPKATEEPPEYVPSDTSGSVRVRTQTCPGIVFVCGIWFSLIIG